ncbi:MAG: MATE family efflux transporter [Betaproteobacteria bacterium]|nr:MATE family efflux transporter [Betaproteobacteria bacterium]
MFRRETQRIAALAWPILVAQIAAIGMMIVDTVVLGHYATKDLAAVAVGSGVYVAILFALVGILQAVAPIVAHLVGAKEDHRVAGALQQSFWLALALCVPGVLLLIHPDPILALASIEPEVEEKLRAYLWILAWGMPAALFYRVFYYFCSALGRPRPLMVISFVGTFIHALLAWTLAHGAPGLPWGALGALGCAVSNVVVNFFELGCAALFLARSFARYRPFSDWQAPRLAAQREMLRLGLPMGLSAFVEITSFTLIALFLTPLGATVVAGHRVVANIAAVCYMLPLALALATLAEVGQAAGAREWHRSRVVVAAGMTLAAVLSTLLGVLLWFSGQSLAALGSDDPAVRAVALGLIGYVAVYQFFDSAQTVAAHALRGYKITFLPMLAHIVCFWGIGLGGGWWLCFAATPPMGVAGFWIGIVVSLVAAALFICGILWHKIHDLPKD